MNFIFCSMFCHKKVTQQALMGMICNFVELQYYELMTSVNFMQNTHQLPAFRVQGYLCPMDQLLLFNSFEHLNFELHHNHDLNCVWERHASLLLFYFMFVKQTYLYTFYMYYEFYVGHLKKISNVNLFSVTRKQYLQCSRSLLCICSKWR